MHILLCSWFATVALAADTDASVTTVIPADPASVYEVLSDLARWPMIWRLGPGDDSVSRHAGGQPGTTDQLLRWSLGQRSRGRMSLVEATPGESLVYEVGWNRTGLPKKSKPADHIGRIALTGSDAGTEVSWTVERPGSRSGRGKPDKRLLSQLSAAVERLGVVVNAPPPTRPGVEARDAALLWRGMRHRWTYNHRINRSGDWWTVPDCADGCTADQVHASASGSGADRATFTGEGSLLTGPGVRGWYGQIDLWLDGREGELLTERACARLPDGVPDGPVLLRGYDLDAVEAADSLWRFGLALERDGDQVCATADLQMACRTPECGTEALTTYTLTVPFVVVTAPDLHTARERATVRQAWKAKDLRDEPIPEGPAAQVALDGLPDRPAAVGLAGFSIALDAPLHTRGLDIAVRPQPPSADGTVRAELDLFYVQWGPVEMAPLTVAQFAHAGDAVITADVVLVQPMEGCVADATIDGEMYWPGKGADASVAGAETVSAVAFDGCGP
ncbi:MAG: hypothetical protein ACI8PZ_002646 [Myxococcota bacterium]|jgi:uncharacterized protein YndB with AHSA1/START domain